MRWRRKGPLLPLLVFVLHAKMFALDPGEGNSALSSTEDGNTTSPFVAGGNTPLSSTEHLNTTSPYSAGGNIVPLHTGHENSTSAESGVTAANNDHSTSADEIRWTASTVAEPGPSDALTTEGSTVNLSDNTLLPGRDGDMSNSSVMTTSSLTTEATRLEETSVQEGQTSPQDGHTPQVPTTPQADEPLPEYTGSQFTEVDSDGRVTYSYNSRFSTPMNVCSTEAFFESYSGPEDMSLYPSLAITTDDTEPCSRSTSKNFTGERKYFNKINISFSSDDSQILTGGNTQCLCVRLRSPPFTGLSLGVTRKEEWLETARRFYMILHHPASNTKKMVRRTDLIRGKDILFPYYKVELRVCGLHSYIRQNSRSLVLWLAAVPPCKGPGLHVTLPANNTAGLSKVFSLCLMCWYLSRLFYCILGRVLPLWEVALRQSHPAFSVLVHTAPCCPTMSSLQRRFGLPTDLTPFICHSVLLIVHLLCIIRY